MKGDGGGIKYRLQMAIGEVYVSHRHSMSSISENIEPFFAVDKDLDLFLCLPV